MDENDGLESVAFETATDNTSDNESVEVVGAVEEEEEEEEEEVEVQIAPRRPRRKRMLIELQCTLDGRYWSRAATRRCIVRDWKEFVYGTTARCEIGLKAHFLCAWEDDGGGRWLVSRVLHLGMMWLWVRRNPWQSSFGSFCNSCFVGRRISKSKAVELIHRGCSRGPLSLK